MPMNEEVLDVLDRCDADSGLSLVYMERRDYATIRAELTRLTEIAEGVDPLIVRMGEVTTELERANALLREIMEFGEDRELHIRIQDHLTTSANG